MNFTTLRIFLGILLAPLFLNAQEVPEPLVPTKMVTYGNHRHTSRDAIYFSATDSQGNLIILGTTERDFSFTDVKIVSLNKDLEENWTDRLSWGGTSYDYPLDMFIDKDDHIWVISKNYLGGTAANFIITRYTPSGEKLWEYISPEPLETSTLNMRQYPHFFDDEGFLNFSFSRNGQYHPEYSFFRISPQGSIQDRYDLVGPFSIMTNFQNFYRGLSLEYYEGVETLYYLKFRKDDIHRVHVELTEEQDSQLRNSIYEETSLNLVDSSGNYIFIGDGKFHASDNSMHEGIIMMSLTSEGTINFFNKDDPDNDKYFLDATLGENNEILVLSNSHAISERANEPDLSLERYSQSGELLSSKRIPGLTANFGKFSENGIIIRTTSGEIQQYNEQLQLISSTSETAHQSYFHLSNIHSIEEKPFEVGTYISKKYEDSDYLGEQNFHVRKLENDQVSAEFNFNGEGTSKFYNYKMVEQANGEIIVSCREFYGPHNIGAYGSKAPSDKKLIRFSSELEYMDEEIVDFDFDLWQEPGHEFINENGEKYTYEIGEDERSVNFYRDGNLEWTRNLNLPDNYSKINHSNKVDKEGNFIVSSSLYRTTYGKIHRLTPENEYSFLDTGGSMNKMLILKNNWIFSFFEDYSIRIYAPDLSLISFNQYERNYFDSENAPYLVEKNNKIMLNVKHLGLVKVFNQYGQFESQFSLKGYIHPSVAFFNEKDDFIVYHLTGQGLYTEHGFNWSRLAISSYGDLVEDYLKDTTNNDQDNDGVIDLYDQCPDTPEGVTVNEAGCELLQLPTDNFSIQTRDETCLGSKNGKLSVEVKQEHNYIINLNDEQHEFRLGMYFEALAPGSYTACIMVKAEPQTERCFEFEIREGQSLKATSNLVGKNMNIHIEKGSAPFNVELDGRNLGTFNSTNFQVLVENGGRLKIRSAQECEGDIEILVNEKESVYLVTNPVHNQAEFIFSKVQSGKIKVKIYNTSGQVLISRKKEQSHDNKLLIDTSSLVTGIYYVQFELENQHILKMIKR
ncbi:hypothetical protein GCM10023115_44130 [Pontixanthobacter gangjinensis]|uniref:T9SS type A sorting domain-containing protein n=1 Tax=Christiangramia aestuarii TaxID=1028746 RepID=A0A7M3SY14_9FLAO|nr:T9SS type A sorting domain-containing protein [Christiangramia aestuarii]MUP41495.1 T9SS type A sorting domain-containing protein [Christiangramia aestuarii]